MQRILCLVSIISVVLLSGCMAKNPANESSTLEARPQKTQTVSDHYGVVPEIPGLTERAPKPGRYRGWLDVNGAKLPASLDLVADGADDVRAYYFGTLKISLSPNEQTETIGIYYSNVTYNDLNGTEVDHGTFPITEIALGTNTISGKLVSSFENRSGEIYLEYLSDENDRHQWSDLSIGGTYVGTCEEKKAALQLETMQWSGQSESPSEWLDGFRVHGRFAIQDSLLCGNDELCVKENYRNAEYKLFSNTLSLKSQHEERTCDLSPSLSDGQVLTCGSCSFVKTRSKVEPAFPVRSTSRFRLPKPESAGKQISTDPVGQYYGYIHHETLDAYQLVALNIERSALDETQFEVSGSVFFGEGDSTEFVSYKFESTPDFEGKPVVWKSSGEAVLVVTDWMDPVLEGTWFSKSNGVVGRVGLYKNGVPELPAGLQPMRAFSGKYAAQNWQFDVGANADISEVGSEIYPLQIFGQAIESKSGSYRRTLKSFRYNFYKNQVGFVLDDETFVTGTRRSDGTLEIFWPPPPRFGRSIGQKSYELFQFEPHDADHNQLKR